MSILIVLNGPRTKLIGLFHGTYTIRGCSRNGKALFIIFNSASIPSRRIGIPRRHAPIIKYLPSIIVFLDN